MDAKTTESNKITKEIDNSGIFKIPQPLQFKIRTRNTSALAESSQVNDKIRTRIDKDSIEESLKRFCVKSKAMREKISTRIDEWICSFMQIMEEALNNLLLKSSVCMEDTLAPLNLHDTLNYVKMLYDCHAKTRIIDNLSEILDKCVASKGNLKSSIKPDDFMKMFGYGVMLVSALKKILPTSEELSDAELSLNALLNNIESNAKEFDPELLKTPFVSRADKEEVIRPIFLKDQSYVLDYLKKHFKDWASYKEDYFENHLNNEEINHSDFKVLRTSGKNLNLLKINRSKAICLQNSTENDTAKDTQSKIIRLIENKPCSNIATITEPKLMEFCKDDNENVPKDNNEDNLYPKVIKQVTNITKTIEKNASEIDGPKMIRNMTLIDEYEKRIQNREPLDLDLLDYSEIYEPSVAENPEFDIIEENGRNENNFENIGFTNMFTENFTNDIQLDGDIFHTEASLDKIFKINYEENSKTNPKKDTFYSVSGNTDQDGAQKIHEKSFNDNSSDKNISNNDSCVANDVSDINVDSENVEIRSANFEKSAQVLDESTNDSGFENDNAISRCAGT
uniref:Uncharacterized protein n=1 Tax=Heliothis virescens TaxID=7102 RepID=A0A2A4JYE6_HELVI